MKFAIELESSGKHEVHGLETNGPLSAAAQTVAGTLDFVLDGVKGSADWSEVSPGVYSVLLNGESYEVRVLRNHPTDGSGENTSFAVSMRGAEFAVRIRDRRARQKKSAAAGEGPLEIRAPMPGRIVKLLANEGQDVKSGAGLLVIEAMKMQNEIRASRSGRVDKIWVKEGEGVENGARLVVLV